MVKGFMKPPVKKIDKGSDLEEDIERYKLNKNISTKEKGYNINDFNKKSALEKEYARIHLKENFYKIMMKGNKNFREELEEIFEKNQERFLYENSDPNFLFNQLLTNSKKTLLYIACQEGNYELVEYLLEKNLNTSIKSKSDNDEYETCLQVAARWNYSKLVALLLDKGNISPDELKETLKNKSLKKHITELINKDLLKKSGRNKKGCACF